MPNPSIFPLIAAFGLFLLAFGMIVTNPVVDVGALGVPVVSAFGGVLMLGGVYGWSFEPAG